jgi:hypothetical protein
MRRAGVGIGLVWFIIAAAVLVFAQEKDSPHHGGKAGLWEISTTMTWVKSPVQPGMPGGPPRGGTHTAQYCLTQAMVDAGALLPESHGECRIENKVVKPGSLTGMYVCTGKMTGMGKVESTIVDQEHVTGSIHFEGTMDVNGQSKPIEWTATSSAVFKSADCNSPVPAKPSPGPAK